MAGTPYRNNSRPSGGTRRPGTGTRRPSTGTRRPSTGRRRKARRRTTPFWMQPGFWLIICIIIVVLILIFRGCKSEDMTDGNTVGNTESVSASGPVIIGNTGGNGGNPGGSNNSGGAVNGNNSGGNNGGSDQQGANSENDQTPGQNSGGEETIVKTMRVKPGIYVIGESSLPAGKVNIEVYSGSGSISSTDGQFNLAAADTGTSPMTGKILTAGTYVTVTGTLQLNVNYTEGGTATAVTAPRVTEDSEFYFDKGSWDMDTELLVMDEAGDLKPGIYQVDIYSGQGAFSVIRNGQNTVLDFTVSKGGDYNDTVNYLKLNAGDRVILKGCMLNFTEMKEG